ncbi:hypothetical protein D3C85_1937650 [compost metagenome]
MKFPFSQKNRYPARAHQVPQLSWKQPLLRRFAIAALESQPSSLQNEASAR